ncbi:MAG: peptide chain release factor 2 [Deltaproteobacteria bacterium]|nr:peptide chain release factor 2 [Deltaproteobacteria bacterium]
MADFFDASQVKSRLAELAEQIQALKGFLDIERNLTRLNELEEQAASPDFWNDNEKAKTVLAERSACQGAVERYKKLESLYGDAQAALELAQEDSEFEVECKGAVSKLETEVAKQDFLCKMNGEFDRSHAIVEITAGAGGTEAQDWANMLLRMYLRWAERKGFAAEELDYQAGEAAGIKNSTILVKGEFAYGFLRSEQGVHRLVRISPFDSNARRHTSFAAVTVTPDIEQEIEIVIDDKDLKVDTYRSGGAGGQHVNRTDSAVRLTHLPTGIVVACQNERSQHKNKDRAMRTLKAKLYEIQKEEQSQKIDSLKGERRKIEWGSQIRSYVLQPYRMIKDLRSDFETSNVDAVLDGDLDDIIQSCLLQGAAKKNP